MPTFKLNKLVRDKFEHIYSELGQTVAARHLDGNELREQLRQKIIEEATELPVHGTDQQMIDEIGDVQQSLDDLRAVCGITSEQMRKRMAEKLAQKGGFTDGLFIDSITLDDDDEWVEYYRKYPEKYPEIDSAKHPVT